jgi:hypothetical protein
MSRKALDDELSAVMPEIGGRTCSKAARGAGSGILNKAEIGKTESTN